MGRRILAVVAGIVTAFILVMLLEGAGHRYLISSDVDVSTMEKAKAAYEAGLIPTIAILGVAVAYWIASFAGGFVAAKIAVDKHQTLAFIIGTMMVAATLWNLLTIPHPIWFWFVGLLPQLPLALLGGKIGAGGSSGASGS
ncbi:MAG: hypothetical protein IH855_04475 [Bacteroidetes bacterium]|nr:hypothetical protein [Bacteroidota bacterium]